MKLLALLPLLLTGCMIDAPTPKVRTITTVTTRLPAGHTMTVTPNGGNVQVSGRVTLALKGESVLIYADEPVTITLTY